MDALAYNRSRKYSQAEIRKIQRVVGAPVTGEWDDATVAEVRDFQQDEGLDADGKVGEGTFTAIEAADRLDEERSEQDEGDEDEPEPLSPLDELRRWCAANDTELIDYRDLKQWPRKKAYPRDYGYPRDKSRAHPPKNGVVRSWAKITSFMLHTTAVAGMNSKRCLGIPCHLYLPKEDAIVLCHELELLLYHGHRGNNFSVGLEISGKSAWDSPSQVERARALLRYFKAVRRQQVGDDAKCYVMAHRMSHESRTNDPGKQIWQDAGEWAIREEGFLLGPVVGSGKSIDPWR